MNSIKKVFYIIFRSPLFVLLIKKSKVEILTGVLPIKAFEDCQKAIFQSNVESGTIYASYNLCGNIVLKSTIDVPKDVLQKIKIICNSI